jgi:hypothetical protein
VSAPATHRGTAFGLIIESNVPVAGLLAAHDGCAADVQVVLREGGWTGWRPRDSGAVPWYVSAESDAGIPWLTVWREDRFQFEYAEGVTFAVSTDGRHIEAAWTSPLVAADVASYLLGPVLAFALRLRGVVPLHASGVAVAGRAWLFTGPAGAGKSTTVSALGTLGYPVLSDDVVPLELTAHAALAWPGVPRLSVWKDASTAVFGSCVTVPPVSAVYEKGVLDLPAAGLLFQDVPVPIETIFVLGERSSGATRMVDLAGHAAAMALVANTYGIYLLDRELRRAEFDVLSALVRRVRVRALQLEDNLGDVVRQVETVVSSAALRAR